MYEGPYLYFKEIVGRVLSKFEIIVGGVFLKIKSLVGGGGVLKIGALKSFYCKTCLHDRI